ncbi:MAG: spore coat protein CotJB [Oscillospiraceae bacterium]|nr:spore coat protein CotJB [Oscillospiraceae bacterium]
MAETPLQSLDSMGRAELLNKVQSHAFAMRDLALYLDTHPTDAEALERFTEHGCAYKKYADAFAERFGALTMTQIGTEDGWPAWSNTPWPWEKEAN